VVCCEKALVREAALYGLGEIYVAYSHRNGVTWIANQCLHAYFSHAVEDRFVITVDCLHTFLLVIDDFLPFVVIHLAVVAYCVARLTYCDTNK